MILFDVYNSIGRNLILNPYKIVLSDDTRGLESDRESDLVRTRTATMFTLEKSSLSHVNVQTRCDFVARSRIGWEKGAGGWRGQTEPRWKEPTVRRLQSLAFRGFLIPLLLVSSVETVPRAPGGRRVSDTVHSAPYPTPAPTICPLPRTCQPGREHRVDKRVTRDRITRVSLVPGLD